MSPHPPRAPQSQSIRKGSKSIPELTVMREEVLRIESHCACLRVSILGREWVLFVRLQGDLIIWQSVSGSAAQI